MTATVLTKKRAELPTDNPHSPETRIELHDIPIAPRKPIRIGQRIHLFVLISCDGLFPSHSSYTPPHYTTHDSGIVGRVERIRSMDGGVTEFVVKNDNEGSRVTHAYVSIQHIQGVTVHLSPCARLARAARGREKVERRVPLESDAVVFRDTTTTHPEPVEEDPRRME